MKKIFLFLLHIAVVNNCFSQNVGIGTSTPLSKLHVSGTASEIATFTGGNQMYITLAEGTFNRAYIGSYSGNTEDVDFGTHGSNPTGNLHLVTGSIPRLTVNNIGNIGIGLTNPEQPLSIKGGVVIDQTNLNTGTAANTLRFGSGSGEAIGSRRVSGINQYALDFYTQSQNRMTINNSGNIGIGLINPASKLELRGPMGFSSTTKKWEMNYDSTAGYFYIDEFGAGRRLYIKNGGNVGIGTSNPTSTLDVNGDINIENKILLNNSAGNSGQVLVSGGSGAAPSWKNTAYGTNDRFMFNTNFWLSSTPANFSHAIEYTNVYSNSGAITYANGGFTVHKAGFYGIEGSTKVALKIFDNNPYPGAINFFLDVLLPSFYSLRIHESDIDHRITEAGFKYYGKTIPYSFKIYFPAGTLFNFHFSVASGNTAEAFIDNLFPLSIYLISE